MASDPTWGGVDFGFTNTDSSDVRSFCQTIIYPPRRAQSSFAFPSVDGMCSSDLGLRSQRITWIVTSVFKGEDHWSSLRDAITAAANTGSHQMVIEGETRPCVLLRDGPTPQGPREILSSPWAFGVTYTLEFEDLTP